MIATTVEENDVKENLKNQTCVFMCMRYKGVRKKNRSAKTTMCK